MKKHFLIFVVPLIINNLLIANNVLAELWTDGKGRFSDTQFPGAKLYKPDDPNMLENNRPSQEYENTKSSSKGHGKPFADDYYFLNDVLIQPRSYKSEMVIIGHDQLGRDKWGTRVIVIPEEHQVDVEHYNETWSVRITCGYKDKTYSKMTNAASALLYKLVCP